MRGESRRQRATRRPRLYRVAYRGPGALSIMGRPHARALARTLRSLRRRGVTTIVSTLSEREVAQYHLGDEAHACAAAGLDFYWWPITEYGIPHDVDAQRLLPDLRDRLLAGDHVVIHCRMALGRAPMVAAALLAELGFETEDAWRALIAARRHRPLARASQRAWVRRWATNDLGAITANG